MAKNTYYVVFENNTVGAESPVANNPKGGETPQNVEANDKSFKKAFAFASVKYAESIVNRINATNIGTIELRTGHGELQARMQFAYGIAKQGFDMAITSAFAGAIFGAPGAVVSAIASVGSSLIDIGERHRVIQMKKANENVTIHLNNIRAGASQDRLGRTK